MKIEPSAVCCVLGAVPLAAGCGGGSPLVTGPGTGASTAGSGSPAPTKGQTATSQNGALQFTVTTDQAAYLAGQPVQVTFTVKNTGTSRVGYETEVGVDATISQGNTVVWQYSKSYVGQGFDGINFSLGPGQSITAPLTWSGANQSGGAVPPGDYTVRAWWTPVSVGDALISPAQAQTQYAAPPVVITIQAGSFTPPPPGSAPAAPTGLTASVNSQGIVTLSWTVSADAAD